MERDPRDTFTQTFRVRYEECGPGGAIHAAVYMRYLQDLAFAHSAALGYPLEWYESHRLFWLVRRAHLTVHAPAGYGEDLQATTQVEGMRRVMARRRNEIRRTRDGAVTGAAIVDWVFTKEGTVPIRVPDDFARAFPGFARSIAPLPVPEAQVSRASVWSPVRVRTSDTDAMAHANNAVYVDLLDDAVGRAGGVAAIGAYPRTYGLQYHAAASGGTVLRDVAWRDGDVWHYRLESITGHLHVHGRLFAGGIGEVP